MRVNIGCGGEITVSEPVLDLLHRNVVCQQQAGAAMTEIVEAYPSKSIILQKLWKSGRYISRTKPDP